MNNVRFMYIRNSKWEPVGCLAIRILRDKNRVEYGCSVCHPMDTKDSKGKQLPFNRAQSQALASIRLNCNPNKAFIAHQASQHDVSRAVLENIIASGTAPTRAIKFAKKWLGSHYLNLGIEFATTSESPKELDPYGI